jgi:hypothetical protein
MPFISVPSVELVIDNEGTKLLYLCDQRCSNNSFTGMVTPPIGLDPEIEKELLHIGKIFGDYVHKLGFRGVCDVDTCLTADGSIYVTETNFRRTGGTYLDSLMRCLIGDDYLDHHVWWADVRMAEGNYSLYDGYQALKKAGLAFDTDLGQGLILTADSIAIDGKWRYLIVAPNHDVAAETEAKVEEVLQLRKFV